MADLRITPAVPAATAPASGRTDAVRAAQRAFFQAALNPSAAPKAVIQTGVAPTVPKRAPNTSVQVPEEPTASRIPRPGSFLDIKV